MDFRRNTAKSLRVPSNLGVYMLFAWILLGVVGWVLVPVSCHDYGNGYAAQLASCGNNLRQIALSLKMYSGEVRGGYYPPVATDSDNLIWDMGEKSSEYMPDLYVLQCGADRDAFDLEGLDWTQARMVAEANSSYFYFGYVLLCDEDVVDFYKYYQEWRENSGIYNEWIGNGVALPDFLQRTDPSLKERSIGLLQFRESIPRLRDGIQRFFITVIGHPAANTETQSRIPIIFEYPGHHKDPGGNVVYLDGHVEFIPMGEWPYTETTLGIIEEIRALGED